MGSPLKAESLSFAAYPWAEVGNESYVKEGILKGKKQLNIPVTGLDLRDTHIMATHSSVLAWRIPGMGDPGGLPSMGSHRIGHD